MQRLNLKTRLILAFSLFSVLLALFYWVLLAGFMLSSEDAVFDRQLNNELQRQLAYHQRHQHFDTLPVDMTIFSDSEASQLPIYPELALMEDGLEEYEDYDIHVAKARLTSDTKPFFIIYSVANQEIDSATLDRFKQIGFTAFVIVSLTGIFLGIITGSRVASPIVRLDQRVQALKRDESFGETASFGSHEIGRLAQSFAAAYDRTQQFLVREKRFTREVSHELRTPTAVIQGALDILELKPDNPQALGRIRRACGTIQQLIDTFLLLGREQNPNPNQLDQEPIDVQSVCQTVIEQHEKTSKVPINFHPQADPQLQVLPSVFAILLGNLLDNAVRHTPTGQIDITLDKEQLIVADTGSGFPPQMLDRIGQPYVDGCSGQGLGLSIVSRICQQFGWQLKIESSSDQGSQIRVRFSDPP